MSGEATLAVPALVLSTAERLAGTVRRAAMEGR